MSGVSIRTFVRDAGRWTAARRHTRFARRLSFIRAAFRAVCGEGLSAAAELRSALPVLNPVVVVRC